MSNSKRRAIEQAILALLRPTLGARVLYRLPDATLLALKVAGVDIHLTIHFDEEE